MLVFPNAKINLGLNILRKRPDGYHDLETCFYPVMWKDALEAVPAVANTFVQTGVEISDQGKNIVQKAYDLLSSDYSLPPVNIHLHKDIPIGAGLGGGSSDAAFALRLFNDLFKLGLNDDLLMRYATRLGADCPFFIRNKPMLASGIGEQLSEIELSVSGLSIILIYPNIHISTKEAYSAVHPQVPSVSIKEILTNHAVGEWRQLLVNDFETALFPKYPVLPGIKEMLYESGALYASMSGSGSCIFGIFDKNPGIDFNQEYRIWKGKL